MVGPARLGESFQCIVRITNILVSVHLLAKLLRIISCLAIISYSILSQEFSLLGGVLSHKSPSIILNSNDSISAMSKILAKLLPVSEFC